MKSPSESTLRRLRCSRSGAAAPILAVGLLLLGGSCARPATETAGQVVPVLVLVEDGRTAVDPGERIGPSSRLLLGSVEDGRVVARELESGRIAGSPVVAWDGLRLLFAARRSPEGPLSLATGALPDGPFELLDTGDLDVGSGDFLPDGRIVFSARVDGPTPTPELSSRWALFVLDPETGTVHRITYGESEIDPTVLADGRIAYAGWLPGGDGRPEGGAFALFAVHPDGSGMTPFHGVHGGPRLRLAPRTLADGDVVVLAGERAEDLRARRIDRRDPFVEASEVGGAAGSAVLAATGWHDGEILLLTADGRLRGSSESVPSGDAEGVTDLAAAIARPRPQGHLSMVDPTGDRGRVFGVDARPPARRDEAAALRVRARTRTGSEAELGRVALAADGSYFLDLPADVQLFFDVVDASGKPLEVSTTPIWLRPGEKRGCVGCHENPATAPPNRRPLAVLEDPTVLGFPETTR